MRILITGAFGNLGLMCVSQSLALGYTVRCFDIDNANTRKIAEQFSGLIEVIFGDIRNNELLPSLVDGVDAIIHNASLLPPLTDTQVALADAINITACQALIRLAEQQEKKPVFIFPSSVTVYGFIQEGGIRQASDPVEATDNYTRHKITIEKTLQSSDLPWCVLRVGVSVDSRTLKTDKSTFAKLLSVKADNNVEYIHPKDVALAMCRAASTPEAQGKILLLGGGKSCQVKQHEFLSTAFNAMGMILPITVHGNERFYTHWMDTTESQKLLNFQQHDFKHYQQEMAEKLKVLRVLLFPLRWLVNPIIVALLKWLQKNG